MAAKEKFLSFLNQPDKVFLAQILWEPNNIELLESLIYVHIRKRLFARPLHPSEKPLVRQIASTLRAAIVDTLRKQVPSDAKYGGRKILRYHWKRAGAVINRALEHLDWICMKDFLDHPVDSIESSVKRICLKVRRLPKYGRSKSQLWDCLLYSEYMEEYKTLKADLQVKDWKHQGVLSWRMEFLKRLYPWAPEQKLHSWTRKPPFDIAWEVVSLRWGPKPPAGANIPDPGRPHRSPAYLRRMQRQARILAKKIDEALENLESTRSSR